MRFLRAVFWEFVQNLPLIAGFVIALQFWQQDRWLVAITFVVVSSALGSMIIRVTESEIVKDFYEPIRVTLANIVVLAVLMLVFLVYLSAGWSSWKTDLLLGTPAGIVLGVVQDLAAGESISVGHTIALACSSPLALIGIRTLISVLPVLVSILIITIAITLIISLIDYGPDHIRRTG